MTNDDAYGFDTVPTNDIQHIPAPANVIVETVKSVQVLDDYKRLVELVDGIATLKTVERAYILQVVDLLDGNKTAAAKALGISVKGLYNKLHEYGFNFKIKGDKQ